MGHYFRNIVFSVKKACRIGQVTLERMPQISSF